MYHRSALGAVPSTENPLMTACSAIHGPVHALWRPVASLGFVRGGEHAARGPMDSGRGYVRGLDDDSMIRAAIDDIRMELFAEVCAFERWTGRGQVPDSSQVKQGHRPSIDVSVDRRYSH
jgi:hypothetical protein